ncbi:MAG TPA: hypothetical protein VLA62_07275, partial [Solirubrobacterales bacterium]|nr:hypothetical protein [Solirubrobacterales bacterium]
MRPTTIALASVLFAALPAPAPSAEPPATAPAPAAAPTPAPAPAPAEPEIQLEPYQLVLLQRPANRTDYPPEKLEQIQAAHLEHLGAMAKA